MQTLLILGAGPKAIAIATKRFVLAKSGCPMPQLVIVDNQGIVAHWSGKFGFTDGRQLLGTRPEKDVGFNPLWFTTLLDEPTRERLGDRTGSFERRTTERAIGEDLSVRDFEPRLHLPLLAGVSQGPGFPNLSCLGLLSDRILSSYGVIAQAV